MTSRQLNSTAETPAARLGRKNATNRYIAYTVGRTGREARLVLLEPVTPTEALGSLK